MKKIIISVFALLTLTSSNMSDWATIHCQPDLNKCIQNLNHCKFVVQKKLYKMAFEIRTGYFSYQLHNSFKSCVGN